jgi:hypothetical protein
VWYQALPPPSSPLDVAGAGVGAGTGVGIGTCGSACPSVDVRIHQHAL